MAKIKQIEEMRKKIKALKKVRLTVGVQSETGTNLDGDSVSGEEEIKSSGLGSGLTYKELAGVHEFGYMGKDKNGRKMNIPERSFVRNVANDVGLNRDLKAEVQQNIAGYVLGKRSLDKALQNIGHHAVTDIVVRMSVDKAPLKEVTKKQRDKKGFSADRALVAGGQLQNHVTYVIHKGGK